MMLFGQYLVKIGLITEDKLLAALIAQSQATPSFAYAVHKSKALPAKDQLAAMAWQAKTGCDYRRACQELGLWSHAAERAVSEVMVLERRPLGQVLVDRGDITVAALGAALDTYVKEWPAAAAPPSATRAAFEDYARLFDEAEKELLLHAEPAVRARRARCLLIAARFLGDAGAAAIWETVAAGAEPAQAAIEQAWVLRQQLVGKAAA
jgi:hypothetical protein